MSNEKCCAFCGATEEESSLLISTENGDFFICIDCVENISTFNSENSKISEETKEEPINIKLENLQPKKIKSFLDENIVGQDDAKKDISVVAYNFLKKIILQEQNEEIQKTNMLLIGSSGTGKTLIMEQIAKILDVPFVIIDASGLTENGYSGTDIDTIFTRLVSKTNDVSKIEKSIVFIDEIDKLAQRQKGGQDVIGKTGVQQSLLKIIEGTEIPVTFNENTVSQETVTINTKDILFIGAGSFEGLEDIISKRTTKGKKLGFDISESEDKHDLNKQVTSSDLIEFGIIPELLGRLHTITVLDDLTDEQMTDILTKPKNSIVNQYKKLLEIDNIQVEFEQSGLLQIVDIARNNKTGARGLRSVVDRVLKDVCFHIDEHHGKTIIVDEKFVKNSLNTKKFKNKEKI